MDGRDLGGERGGARDRDRRNAGLAVRLTGVVPCAVKVEAAIPVEQ
jgi:hypothetical protein